MTYTYLHTRLSEINEPQILELFSELAAVKRMPASTFHGVSVFNGLSVTQQHPVSCQPEKINAKNHYKGSLLKTRMKALQGQPVYQLALELCHYWKINEEFIDGMQYYVFLNQIMNEKSALRKPQPFYL